jgi:hypothetical protein
MSIGIEHLNRPGRFGTARNRHTVPNRKVGTVRGTVRGTHPPTQRCRKARRCEQRGAAREVAHRWRGVRLRTTDDDPLPTGFRTPMKKDQ